MLKNVKLIDENEINTEIIHVGSRAKVKNLSSDRESTYKIVGSNEANPLEGRISDESPVGKALLGKKPGDKITVETPGGTIVYEVLEIGK